MTVSPEITDARVNAHSCISGHLYWARSGR